MFYEGACSPQEEKSSRSASEDSTVPAERNRLRGQWYRRFRTCHERAKNRRRSFSDLLVAALQNNPFAENPRAPLPSRKSDFNVARFSTKRSR
jgi:hypothetical protein